MNYDYVYLLIIDDIFTNQYLDSIMNPEVVKDHVLYRIDKSNENMQLFATD